MKVSGTKATSTQLKVKVIIWCVKGLNHYLMHPSRKICTLPALTSHFCRSVSVKIRLDSLQDDKQQRSQFSHFKLALFPAI